MFVDEYHKDPPKILGEEFVGTVEAVGGNLTGEYEAGDVVAGWVYGGGKAYDGAYAEYVVVHKMRVHKISSETSNRVLPWTVLGAIPMSMWTAWGSLFIAGETKEGATVLIHGATSSVGIWAILLAKDRKCKVIATTRQEWKVQRLREAGADHVVLEENLKDEVRKIAPKGVDTILELVGPDKVVNVSLPLLARHGTVVVTGVLTKGWTVDGFTPAMIPPTRKITMYGTMDEDIPTATKVLNEVVEKVRSGVFKPEVFLDKVFSLEDVGKAHEYMEENKAVGKVVIQIDPN